VPDNTQGQQCLRDWGDKASSFAESTLSGEEVRITFDENEGRRGYYDRLLAYVYVDDMFYNYELVEEGVYSNRSEAFRKLAEEGLSELNV
jgi:micrococcal nuclease